MSTVRTSGPKGKVPRTTKSPPRCANNRGHDPRSNPLSTQQDNRYGTRRGRHTKISSHAQVREGM